MPTKSKAVRKLDRVPGMVALKECVRATTAPKAPSLNPWVVQLRGTPDYVAFLDELAAVSGAVTRNRAVEDAVALYARKFGLTPPRRTRPAGRPRNDQK